MRKKIFAMLSVVLTFVLGLSVFAGCADKKRELKYALDESVPFLYGDDITKNLGSNPFRGLRYEFYITLNDTTDYKRATAYPGNTDTVEQDLAEKTERFADYDMTTAQLYVYLCNYNDRAITDNAFYQLSRYLSALKSKGITCLVRFAYEYTEHDLQGPTSEQMLSHISQIKQWLKNNATLVKSSVLAFQAGFIGLWGEWHTSEHPHNLSTVVNAVYDMIPDDFYLQVRTADIKSKASAANRRMIGYHDDYETGVPNEWHVAGGKTKSSKYKNFLKESPLTVNDGEMPWGRSGVSVDGINFIKSMQEHCYTTFSAEHNFIEEQGSFSMAQWQGHLISASTLEEIGSVYNPFWFKDKNGNDLDRTVFDYVRDFLGYQLVASNLKVEDKNIRMENDAKGNPQSVCESDIEFVITNFGTAAPLVFDKMEIIFRNRETGAVHNASGFNTQLVAPQWKPQSLRSMGQLKITISDVKRNTGWQVGVKIYRSGTTQTIRLANDIPYLDGVNYLN